MKTFSKWIAAISILIIPGAALANDDWSWTTDPTPGASNSFVNEEGETQENYSNGDLSAEIILSEIMPNPEGSDTDNEWIEIYNSGSNDVDLGNWQIDDEEEGSDAYTFPSGTVVEAQDFYVVYRSESNISLNNDTDEVRLFDFELTLQDSVSYDSAPEGQSYARISVEGEDSVLSWLIPTAHASTVETTWEWTGDITKGYTNPIYHFISGTIEAITPFENRVTLNQNGTLIDLSLEKIELNEELKMSLFQTGNIISGYATLIENDVFELKSLKDSTLTSTGISSPSTNKYTQNILLLSLLTAISGIYFVRRQKMLKTTE